MKKILLSTILSVFLFSCNINPSKEERIQKLETEIQKATLEIKDLKSRIELLEKQLK